MLLERLPSAGGQVHSEGAPREEGGWEVGGREGAGREVPLRGDEVRGQGRRKTEMLGVFVGMEGLVGGAEA